MPGRLGVLLALDINIQDLDAPENNQKLTVSRVNKSTLEGDETQEVEVGRSLVQASLV